MNFQQFQKSVQDPQPAYLLCTDQDYLKVKVMEFCEKQVDESSRAFDWAVFNLAKDRMSDAKGQLQNLIDTARTLPWMSKFRWIYVKNAHEAGKELGEYLEDPAPRTVIVLETTRKVRSWPRLAAIEIGNHLDHTTWLLQKAEREGYSMDREAADTLVSLVGGELSRLDSELEKQFLWCLDTKTITVDSALSLAVEGRERDIFELISAMAGSRSDVALRILNRLFETGTSHQQILSMLYWNFRRLLVASEMLARGEPYYEVIRQLKLWSYKNRQSEVRGYSRAFLSSILLKLRETDRLLKTTPTVPQIHLERVIIDTCGKASV